MKPDLVVITGPVGAGKSTTANALARKLRGRGRRVGVIDLDSVYSMTRQRDGFDDRVAWSAARVAAVALAQSFFAAGIDCTIIDGELFALGQQSLDERDRARCNVRTFTLSISYETALLRVQPDPTRGVSKDPKVLRWLHDEFVKAQPHLRGVDEILDAERESADSLAQRIADAIGSQGEVHDTYATIEIVDHRESWSREFRDLARLLRAALGDLALRIDHIGSTSVPGLCAKDIIDVQISVAALMPQLATALRAIGYTQADDISFDHRPPNATGGDDEWTKWFFRPPSGQRRTHVHVRVHRRSNQRYALLFRDYLRAHPGTADAYGELKRRLAVSLIDPNDYPDVKDPAVDLIYLPAQEWAARVRWQPNDSDA